MSGNIIGVNKSTNSRSGPGARGEAGVASSSAAAASSEEIAQANLLSLGHDAFGAVIGWGKVLVDQYDSIELRWFDTESFTKQCDGNAGGRANGARCKFVVAALVEDEEDGCVARAHAWRGEERKFKWNGRRMDRFNATERP